MSEKKWKGPKHVTPKMMAELAVLIEDPDNARKHDDRNVNTIAASLDRFGQQKPIVVDKLNTVCAGNGTLRAAMSLGWTHLWVSRTELEGSEARAFAITDNRSAELAEWDNEILAMSVQSLLDDGVNLAELGWEQFELDPLLSADWKPPAKGDLPEGPEDLARILVKARKEDEERVRAIVKDAIAASDVEGVAVE